MGPAFLPPRSHHVIECALITPSMTYKILGASFVKSISPHEQMKDHIVFYYILARCSLLTPWLGFRQTNCRAGHSWR